MFINLKRSMKLAMMIWKEGSLDEFRDKQEKTQQKQTKILLLQSSKSEMTSFRLKFYLNNFYINSKRQRTIRMINLMLLNTVGC